MNVSGKVTTVHDPDPERPGLTRRVLAYYLADEAGVLVRVGKAEYDARFPSKLAQLLGGELLLAGNTPSIWPKVSEALAVHPDQVQEAQAKADRHGVCVTYTPRGDVVVPDRGNWLKLLAMEKCHEKS